MAYTSCIKGIEMYQKIKPFAVQLVLRDQKCCMKLGLVSDYSQSSTVSLMEFSQSFHNHSFTDTEVLSL